MCRLQFNIGYVPPHCFHIIIPTICKSCTEYSLIKKYDL